jgi:hypothetical protein
MPEASAELAVSLEGQTERQTLVWTICTLVARARLPQLYCNPIRYPLVAGRGTGGSRRLFNTSVLVPQSREDTGGMGTETTWPASIQL